MLSAVRGGLDGLRWPPFRSCAWDCARRTCARISKYDKALLLAQGQDRLLSALVCGCALLGQRSSIEASPTLRSQHRARAAPSCRHSRRSHAGRLSVAHEHRAIRLSSPVAHRAYLACRRHAYVHEQPLRKEPRTRLTQEHDVQVDYELNPYKRRGGEEVVGSSFTVHF